VSHRPYHLALLAEALSQAGQIRDGLATLQEALALSTASGERFLEAELYRLRGELLLAGTAAGAEAWDAAEACFRQALAVARSQAGKSLELRAAMSLGHLYRAQGRPAEARPFLAETYSWFTEGFDTPDLQEAKALLGLIS
jgi:predicted ATPase